MTDFANIYNQTADAAAAANAGPTPSAEPGGDLAIQMERLGLTQDDLIGASDNLLKAVASKMLELKDTPPGPDQAPAEPIAVPPPAAVDPAAAAAPPVDPNAPPVDPMTGAPMPPMVPPSSAAHAAATPPPTGPTVAPKSAGAPRIGGPLR